MLGRLLLGLVKGLIVGGLVGAALAKAGFAAPGAVVAYLAAAFTGAIVGLVAGKPIWAKDATIEAGMKAAFGALVAAGLMYAARRWLTVPLPFSLGELGGANASLGEAASSSGTLGGTAITALAAIAALLGGFYEADNTPEPTEKAPADAKGTTAANPAKRIASGARLEADDDLDHLEVEPDRKRTKR